MGSHLAGYGQQTGIFTPRIAALGHDVALSVYYGLQGAEMRWNGLRCLPSYSAAYGCDTIVPHALHHFEAEKSRSLAEASSRGLIVTLGDVHTFDVPLLDQFAVASWVPIDHLTVPDVVRRWFEVMGAVPIAMSRFGEAALRDAGLNPLYVPHGIDTRIFCPGDKAAARAAVGLPEDAFVVGMVANNVGRDGSRKAFSEQVAAFAELRRRHSDAMLVLHTDVDQPIGVRLRPLLERMLPQGSYTYTDQYAYRKGMSPRGVADIYRALDVLSNTSYGEGFGIPIVEAQATGCPVIVTDSTAMPELVGAGWKVGYEQVWHDSMGAWTSTPHIGEIANAYEEAYEKARDESMRAEAWLFAQDYDADLVTERYWRPVLDRFADALERRAEDAAKRPKRRSIQVREADGLLWVDHGGDTGDSLGWADHEKELRPVIEGLLPDGGVFLDVGAHVGHWSLRLAGKASKVVAVEANPDTASTLRRNLAVNDVRNVEVLELAAWDEPAALRLWDPVGQVDGGSTRVLPSDKDGEPLVIAGRLDAALHGKLDRLDLVKIDVEGADIHVLDGMTYLVERFHPILFIECHDLYGYYERADLEAALARLGYGWEIVHTYMSTWQPSGLVSEPKPADYLVCRPVRVEANG